MYTSLGSHPIAIPIFVLLSTFPLLLLMYVSELEWQPDKAEGREIKGKVSGEMLIFLLGLGREMCYECAV